MSPDRRQRLDKLLRDHAANGAAPLELRARRRALRTDILTDMELRHNLMMAYGPLLDDLDALGMAQFYRLDLAAVVGRDRVERVLDARYMRPSVRRRRSRRIARRWLLGGVSSLVVASALIGFSVFKDHGLDEFTRLGVTSPVWLAVYRSEKTPAGVRDLMRGQALRYLDQVPIGSGLWRALQADQSLPDDVRDRTGTALKSQDPDVQNTAEGAATHTTPARGGRSSSPGTQQTG